MRVVRNRGSAHPEGGRILRQNLRPRGAMLPWGFRGFAAPNQMCTKKRSSVSVHGFFASGLGLGQRSWAPMPCTIHKTREFSECAALRRIRSKLNVWILRIEVLSLHLKSRLRAVFRIWIFSFGPRVSMRCVPAQRRPLAHRSTINQGTQPSL